MDLSVQYVFGQGRLFSDGGYKHSLGMLMYRLSPSSLSVGLLGGQRALCRMVVTVTDIHPIVTRGSTFRVFAPCMGVTMTRVIF